MLVLNATYEPINVCTVRRATVLLLKSKAEVVEIGTQDLHWATGSLPRPVVIRLVTYVRIPRDTHKRKITRRAVFARDGWMCQYCGARTSLTVDHVIPRSKGGGSGWDNIVASCAPCNRRKADRLRTRSTCTRAPSRTRRAPTSSSSSRRRRSRRPGASTCPAATEPRPAVTRPTGDASRASGRTSRRRTIASRGPRLPRRPRPCARGDSVPPGQARARPGSRTECIALPGNSNEGPGRHRGPFVQPAGLLPSPNFLGGRGD